MTPQLFERPGDEQAADVDHALAALYREHYRSLVRLAALLAGDVAAAERVVQDSFVAMHGRWHRLGDRDRALRYLRESVVSRSRPALRPRLVPARNGAGSPDPTSTTGPEPGTVPPAEQSAVVAAIRGLPRRQREALVLRYYGDLSQAQAAAAMGITEAAVQGHAARAMTALHGVLQG